jgi:hypothetical protein
MTVRSDRILLAVEMLLVVLPVTMIGGPIALLGTVSGSAAVVLAAREHAVNVLPLWVGILTLAVCGLVGIIGLCAAMIALSGEFRSSRQAIVRVALFGSVVGVLAATVTLILMITGVFDRRPLGIYILVSPIVVILHRRPSLKKLLEVKE